MLAQEKRHESLLMKMISLLFSLMTLTHGYALQEGVTPVQKVIQLLQEMQMKGKAEKKDEAVKFSAYKQFCDDQTAAKTEAIKKANALMEQLVADIQMAESEVKQLAKQIAELDAEIAGYKGDEKAATEVRDKEKEDYKKTHLDYSESVDALQRAIGILKKQQFNRAQASLLQVTKMERVPENVKRTIYSFLATDEEVVQPAGLSVSAPEANAYEFQSGGVVEMLEKLLDKFRAELDGYQKEELNAKFNYQTLYQELVSNIDEATASSELKTKVKAERAQDEAAAKGDLEVTKKDLGADEGYLSDLITECDAKSKAYENRQMLRAEELEAIGKAIEIIQSPDVMGAGEKRLPQFIQLKHKTKPHSMSLLRSNQDAPIRAKLISFLSSRAKETKSKLLLMIATKAAAGGPFDKVKKMIKDLIVKLMEEATEESEHKGWCDTELGTNKQTREDKAEQVATLTAESEELEAKIAKLSEEMAALSDDIAAIDKAVAEATALRQKEKEKNTVTIEEAKVAQDAVAKAISVLQEFYAKAADATSLVQTRQPEGISDKPYKGMGGASGGIIGMLEVIESDFARLETETSSSEEQAEEEYTKF